MNQYPLKKLLPPFQKMAVGSFWMMRNPYLKMVVSKLGFVYFGDFFTDCTMVNQFFSPPFVEYVFIVSNHLTSKFKLLGCVSRIFPRAWRAWYTVVFGGFRNDG